MLKDGDLTLLVILFSFFSLFWLITNARISEIIKRIERIEETLFDFVGRKLKKKKKREKKKQKSLSFSKLKNHIQFHLKCLFYFFLILFNWYKIKERIRFAKSWEYGYVSIRNLIYINFLKHTSLEELKDTIIHEALHYLKADLPHPDIYRITSKIRRFIPSFFLLSIIDKFLRFNTLNKVKRSKSRRMQVK